MRQNFTTDAEKLTPTKKTLKVISITVEKTTSENGETQPKILKNGLKIILVMHIIKYVKKTLGPDSHPWEKGRR